MDLDAVVVREVLREEAAADVRVAADVRFVPELLPFADVDRPDVVRLDGVDLDRAVVVGRDDVAVRRLLLEPAGLFEVVRVERELLAAVFPPLRPAAAFLAELLLDGLRVDEVVERPLVVFLADPPAVFFVELLAERLRLVAAAPFLPAALFLADVDEREPPVDFFVVEEAFAVEDRELDVVELFFLAPPEDERAELELFFAPPLLLEPEEEREPVDFLVVAMRIIPPKKWCVPAWATFSKRRAFDICIKLRQRSGGSSYLCL